MNRKLQAWILNRKRYELKRQYKIDLQKILVHRLNRNEGMLVVCLRLMHFSLLAPPGSLLVCSKTYGSGDYSSGHRKIVVHETLERRQYFEHRNIFPAKLL